MSDAPCAFLGPTGASDTLPPESAASRRHVPKVTSACASVICARSSGNYGGVESHSNSRRMHPAGPVFPADGHQPVCLTKPSRRRFSSISATELHGRIGELSRSSGGLAGNSSDQPPQPTSGSKGRLCSQARWTSDLVPARPPITMQASPASAIKRLRASPMPHGRTTVAGHSGGGISSGGTMLSSHFAQWMHREARSLTPR